MAYGAAIRGHPTLAPRLIALVVFTCSLAVLAVATRLTPSASGHGTHTQLGLYSCAWPILFDKPCPTCGMTTAFAHAARGNFGRAFLAQPFGFLLAVGVAGAFWISLHVLATGSAAWQTFRVLTRPRVLWLLLALALASWAYKWATWTEIPGVPFGTVGSPRPNSTP
ncbi:MAG: DUF2752 domain-containing protein [Phycisphaerae bacterium]|nr:DUF2752 domain-containing protein [Phycisphaerae bacterium]